MIILFTIVM